MRCDRASRLFSQSATRVVTTTTTEATRCERGGARGRGRESWERWREGKEAADGNLRMQGVDGKEGAERRREASVSVRACSAAKLGG